MTIAFLGIFGVFAMHLPPFYLWHLQWLIVVTFVPGWFGGYICIAV